MYQIGQKTSAIANLYYWYGTCLTFSRVSPRRVYPGSTERETNMKLRRLSSPRLTGSVIGALAASLLFAAPVLAQDTDHVRLSRSLAKWVASGSAEPANVIYEGPQFEVDRVSSEYGLGLVKRLPGGAVLSGNALQVDRLSRDPRGGTLAADERVFGQMAVTTQTTGASQLWQAAGFKGF